MGKTGFQILKTKSNRKIMPWSAMLKLLLPFHEHKANTISHKYRTKND